MQADGAATVWLRWSVALVSVAGAAGLIGILLSEQRVIFALLFAAFAGLALAGLLKASSVATEESAALVEAKETASSLKREVTRTRDAVDQLAAGLDVLIFLTDRQTNIVYANQRACDAFRFREPAGHRLLAVTFSNELEELVHEAAETGQAQRLELTFHHPAERIGIAQVWAEPGDVGRIFVAIYDITDLRRLERVRRDFVANVSHELRTPMTTIRAMAETLVDDDPRDSDLTKPYLEKIIREIDRLTSITSDLLTLSTAESHASTKERVDLSLALRSACQMLAVKAEDKGLELRTEIEDGLILAANESLLSQVWINLIDNAISYTANGSVVVTASKTESQACVEVKDTGIGIASEHLPRVFERFYRVDKGRSRAKGGTGLGLAIVRNIVEAHGGRVEVESALNEGSAFRVLLPLE